MIGETIAHYQITTRIGAGAGREGVSNPVRIKGRFVYFKGVTNQWNAGNVHSKT